MFGYLQKFLCCLRRPKPSSSDCEHLYQFCGICGDHFSCSVRGSLKGGSTTCSSVDLWYFVRAKPSSIRLWGFLDSSWESKGGCSHPFQIVGSLREAKRRPFSSDLAAIICSQYPQQIVPIAYCLCCLDRELFDALLLHPLADYCTLLKDLSML